MTCFRRAGALLILTASPASGEDMQHYSNTDWREIRDRIPGIAEAGYESLGFPPPTKGGGRFSVGWFYRVVVDLD